jgi:hypothetical protein
LSSKEANGLWQDGPNRGRRFQKVELSNLN